MYAVAPSDREIMKRLLYSLAFSDAHAARLTRWLGRPADEITITASDRRSPEGRRFSTAPLRDDQALIIDGDRADIV